MTVIIVQKLGSEFPRRPAFLGNELRLPPIWGVLELEHPDTMNQRCTKLLEEILVKDAVHAGLLEAADDTSKISLPSPVGHRLLHGAIDP